MRADGLTFPLVPRRRVAGAAFGAMRARRRGAGFDLAGSRPYRPGDDIRRIDHRASARLSSAHQSDEFLVHEHLTEEAARVLLVVDRRPTMSLFPAALPWLHKPAAVAEAIALVRASAARARCPVGSFDGAARDVGGALEQLASDARDLPHGSFVFVLSDFLVFPAESAWRAALARRWDVVPVVIQDPAWEQSFPAVAGTVLPVAGPEGGRVRSVLLTEAEVEERRRANEARLEEILARFAALGLDVVVVSSDERSAILESFLVWAEERRERGRLS